MNDDYLWDGSGEPDPEVQKLETTLGRYRHTQAAPAFDPVTELRPVKGRMRFFNLRFSFQLAAVAATVVIAATLFYFLRRPNAPVDSGPSWEVARLEGTPRLGWHSLGEKSGTGKLGIGQALVTDSSSRASIRLDETGSVEVDAESRLRVVTNGPGRKRLSLERCTWTMPARAFSGPLWAGSASSSTATNLSFPLAPSVRHGRRSAPAPRTWKMRPLLFGTLCLASTLNPPRRSSAMPC